MPTARTKGQLVDLLLARIGVADRSAAEPFARAFVEAVASPHIGVPAAAGGMGALAGSFAIREDDVSIFDCLQGALAAAAPAGFFLHATATAAAIVGIAGALGKFMRDLYVKGAWLDQDKARVLLILKANVFDVASPGLTSEEIRTVIVRTTPHLDLAWVNRQLADLTLVPVRIGTRAFVSRDASDRWRPLV